jgi:hypothetical protein
MSALGSIPAIRQVTSSGPTGLLIRPALQPDLSPQGRGEGRRLSFDMTLSYPSSLPDLSWQSIFPRYRMDHPDKPGGDGGKDRLAEVVSGPRVRPDGVVGGARAGQVARGPSPVSACGRSTPSHKGRGVSRWMPESGTSLLPVGEGARRVDERPYGNRASRSVRSV